MMPRTERRRCIECRKWFHPKPCARDTHVVCGRDCRLRHRSTLAKARRERDLDGYREDERDRQRKSRQARREGANTTGPPAKSQRVTSPVRPCQAPATAANLADLQMKVNEIQDRLAGLSQTILRRGSSQFAAGKGRCGGTRGACHGPG